MLPPKRESHYGETTSLRCRWGPVQLRMPDNPTFAGFWLYGLEKALALTADLSRSAESRTRSAMPKIGGNSLADHMDGASGFRMMSAAASWLRAASRGGRVIARTCNRG